MLMQVQYDGVPQADRAETQTSRLPPTFAAYRDSHDDFFDLLAPNRSPLALGFLHQWKTEEDGGPGQYKLTLGQVRAVFPLPLSRDFALGLGLNHVARGYEFGDVPGAATRADGETLKEVSAALRANWFVNDNLELVGGVQVGLYSDLDRSVNSEDVIVFGTAMALWRVRERFMLLGGLVASEDFEELPVVPMLGLRWESAGGRSRVDMNLPFFAQYTYRVHPRVALHAIGWITGGRYHVHLGSQGSEFDVQVRGQRLGVGARFRLHRNLSWQIEGGTSLGGQFQFKTPNAGQFSGDLNPAPYVSAILALHF